jgi:CubicO group peptidase (beta-lactamase class C family)
MRPLRPFLAALLVVFLPPFEPEARGESRLSAELGPIVRRLMARDHIPGVAVGIVERGQLVSAWGFGYRDLGEHLPVTADTLFPLGSTSKAFTVTAIAMLVDDGRLALDTPVRTYLPDFSLQDADASATVTTRDLLTHRSGLPRHDLFWYQAPFSRDELYHRLQFLEPSGSPHAQWRYNSLMFVVAGRIVETVSGESWEGFVRSRVLAPLHMDRTLLSADAVEADFDRASPYALRDGGAREIPRLTHMSAIAPAGAMQSSVRDLARWLAFHITGSPALLSEALWREMHRPQVEMPPAGEPELQQRHYAMGWICERYRGHPLVFHDGAVDGFTVHLGFLPETGQGVIVLVNRDDATAALNTVAYSAYDRLLGLDPIDWEARLADAPIPLRDVRSVPIDFPLEEVVGTYEHPAYGALTVTARGEQLALQFRTLRFTLVYLGGRQFLSAEPIADGGPQISVRFSARAMGEPVQLSVPLNFEEGDPVEVFTRVT